MTKTEANQYLFQTSWYEIVRYATGQPVPESIARKRKQAYEVLKAQ